MMTELSSNIDKFFLIYEDYLSVDSMIALTDKGRNRNIIGEFVSAYIKINQRKKNVNEDLQRLAYIIDEYISENRQYSITLKNSSTEYKHIPYVAKTSNRLTKSANRFFRASKLYSIHRQHLKKSDLVDLYIKSNQNYQIAYFNRTLDEFEKYIRAQAHKYYMNNMSMLKQSIMEFNNALSHLYSAYKNNTPDQNIEKAKKHIDRGSLDFYKAIIRDRWYLDRLDDGSKREIEQIRKLEYTKIGNDNGRENITDSYCKFVAKILQIKDDFPRNFCTSEQ